MDARKSNRPKPSTTGNHTKQKKGKQGKQKKHLVRKIILSILSICLITVVIVAAYMLIYVRNYREGPAVVDLTKETIQQSQTTIVYAKKGDADVEIARLHGEENRVWVSFDEMPQYLKDAVIALEDKRFEEHKGVDWRRTLSSMFYYQFSQGGSTITQQLIKNLTNEKEVTFVRKFKEIMMALNLEEHYDKDRILEAYLNTIYLNNGCYGIQTAAEKYFGKNTKDLNLAECAALVGVTQEPSKYDPLRKPEENKERQEYCLGLMLEQGKISKQEHDEAVAHELIFTNHPDYKVSEEMKKKKADPEEIYGYYVDYVIDCVIRDFMEQQGMTYAQATNKINYGGLKIYAAVDLEIQAALEDVYYNKVTIEDSKAQSGMTIMDYEGRIVGIIGGLGKKTINRGLNRATSYRAPGSSIKPLSIYAPAFEEDYIDWASTVIDKGIYIKDGAWYPKNYDGVGTGAMVSIPTAIKRSMNTVTAQLSEKMGYETSFNFLKERYHFQKLDAVHDIAVSPMAMGSMRNGTNTVEMAAAYAAFGNGGYYYKPYAYYRVEDSSEAGTVLLENKPKPEQAISPATADIIRELLKLVDHSYFGLNGHSSRFELMCKTGTTQNNHDRWLCMGTPYYVSSTWYGYDIQGDVAFKNNQAARLAGAVYNRMLADYDSSKKFESSGEAVYRKYCINTGILAGSTCSNTATGWFDTAKLPGTCTSCTAVAKPSNNDVTKADVTQAQGGVGQAAQNIIDAIVPTRAEDENE